MPRLLILHVVLLIVSVSAWPAYVDHGDLRDIEVSHPSVNLDLLRYLSDNLNSFFRRETYGGTPDPRGLNFAQFVATDRCSGQAAWSCFNDIDTNSTSC